MKKQQNVIESRSLRTKWALYLTVIFNLLLWLGFTCFLTGPVEGKCLSVMAFFGVAVAFIVLGKKRDQSTHSSILRHWLKERILRSLIFLTGLLIFLSFIEFGTSSQGAGLPQLDKPLLEKQSTYHLYYKGKPTQVTRERALRSGIAFLLAWHLFPQAVFLTLYYRIMLRKEFSFFPEFKKYQDRPHQRQ